MSLRRIPLGARAVLTPILMAAWIASMFLTARLLEETYYRRRTYRCFLGERPGGRFQLPESESVPGYLRSAATQLRTRPNPEIWCGRTPKDAFAPGDDRFPAVQRGSRMALGCSIWWPNVVPTDVPDGWIKSLPSTQAFDTLRELEYAWRSYNDEVDKVRFQTCKANERTRGTTIIWVAKRAGEHKEVEVPNFTWFAEVSPDTVQDYIAQLEAFADKLEAAIARYEPQRNYLLYLSIPVVLAFVALTVLMGLIGGSVLEDLKRKLLELDQ